MTETTHVPTTPPLPAVAPVVVASHPRSGTHLLIDLLRHQFDACRSWKWPGERLDRLYLSIDELGASRGRLDETTARRILSRTARPVVKTHAWPGYADTFLPAHHDGLDAAWVDWLTERATVLYVYRDGRDVLCSYQMLRARMDTDASAPIGAFLRGSDAGASANRVRQWADHVEAWRRAPSTHALAFESILDDPSGTIERLEAWLDLDATWQTPLLPERFSSIWDSRWARLFSMRPTSTAILGVGSKDWTQVFTPSDRAFFHQEAGDLLIDLGYESSDAWVDAP
jgi:hypothetical protein